MNLDIIKDRIKNWHAKPQGIRLYYSVLLPLIKVDGKLNILYEVRADDLNTQPGEISFPGGRVEKGESFKEAAIRETCEELNIEENRLEFLGQLDYMITPYNIIIYSYAAHLKEGISNIKVNSDEVKRIFTVPLNFFLNNEPDFFQMTIEVQENKEFPYELVPEGRNYKWRKGKYPVYFYHYKDYIIWGFTALVTKNFVDIITED
jgi:peroxisomal coenzyme A diphosphatase NUDT7